MTSHCNATEILRDPGGELVHLFGPAPTPAVGPTKLLPKLCPPQIPPHNLHEIIYLFKMFIILFSS